MDKSLKKVISRDKQIIKFCLYGFLKDLKFFEPFLLVYLMSNDLNLLQIGILISIREIIINIFEIPSGFIADYIGRKKELSMCFIFYAVSFVFFFFSKNFGIAAVAMVFFGLGEAFRSGTHKAMIYTYLEEKNWQDNKTYVYGKTRSASLIGSAISSLLAIIIILNVPKVGYIFLASIIPYILDYILIMTYPKSLDKSALQDKISFKAMVKMFGQSIFHNRNLRKILVGEGSFEAVVSSIKDYIQPIMEMLIVGSGILLLKKMSPDDNLHIVLGVLYAFFNVFGSIASRRSYLIKNKFNSKASLNIMHIILCLTMLLLGIFIKNPLIICFIFLIIYLAQNTRKPIFIDEIDNNINKCERATMLSVASQVKSIFVIILAPILGAVADNFGLQYIMYGLAGLLFIIFPFIMLKENK